MSDNQNLLPQALHQTKPDLNISTQIYLKKQGQIMPDLLIAVTIS